jgi:hypothetical protein
VGDVVGVKPDGKPAAYIAEWIRDNVAAEERETF